MRSSLAVRVFAVVAVAVAAGGSAPAARGQNPSGAPAASDIARLIAQADADLAAANFDDMAASSESAAALARLRGDRAALAQALFRLGQARFYQSRNDESIATHREVVEIASRIGDRELRAKGLNGIGVASRELGDYDQAIDYMTEALAAHRAAGNRLEQVRVQRNLAVLYGELGDLRRAESTARLAANMARALGNKPFEAITLQTQSAIAIDAGRPGEALRLADRSLSIARALQTPALLIEAGISSGDGSTAAGDLTLALDKYRAALAEAERGGYAAGQAVTTARIGEAYRRLGNTTEAETWLRRAGAILLSLGDAAHLNQAVAAELALARTLRDAGRPGDALAAYRATIAMIDRMRAAAVSTDALTGSVNAARTDAFVETAELLVNQGREAEAFAIAERYHARAFLGFLSGARGDAGRQDATGTRSRGHALLARATTLQRELWTAELRRDRRDAIDAELAAVDDDFERLAGERRRIDPSYGVHDPELLDAVGVQKSLADDRTAVVEYLLGESRSFAWVVSARGVFTASLPGRKTIADLADRYRRAVSARASVLTLARANREYEQASSALFAAIVAPIESAIAPAARLIIVSDGALAYVPFEPLSGFAERSVPSQLRRTSTNVPLFERFDIRYAPSASALHALAARPAHRAPPRYDLMAVGDAPYGAAVGSAGEKLAARLGIALTPLPHSRAEIDAIGQLFPPSSRRVFVGANAREDRVKAANLADFKYLHFAAHGLLDPMNPARSGLVLATASTSTDDGVLQTREIMQLELNADLVTLSACETGLGRLVNSEGLMGLTRVFFYAGARSVVVSLWDVNDAATAELMKRFYSGLRQGLRKDEALRAAKRALAKGPQPAWRHPYFWAPFVLMGSD